jgi:hypothetical protein
MVFPFSVRYWQASQPGSSIKHCLGSGMIDETELSSPPAPVDFSADVAANERR